MPSDTRSCTNDIGIHDESIKDDGSNFEESVSENETKMQNLQDHKTQNQEETLKNGDSVIMEYTELRVYPSLVLKLQSGEERGLMLECISMISTCWKRYSVLQLV